MILQVSSREVAASTKQHMMMLTAYAHEPSYSAVADVHCSFSKDVFKASALYMAT